MTINEYYTHELQALRILAAEFSEKNPGLSSFLARKGQDPDVERLLEGFSFLTARLRQYTDEELPEVSHTLAQLLWPNYLRPIPSYSILKYTPSSTDTSILVKRGEEVMGVHRHAHAGANRTMIKFLGSIIIALSIEALMLVFKFALTDPDKLEHAVYLIGGVSLLTITLAIYIKFTKEDGSREDRPFDENNLWKALISADRTLLAFIMQQALNQENFRKEEIEEMEKN
jgi:hypothetical protein